MINVAPKRKDKSGKAGVRMGTSAKTQETQHLQTPKRVSLQLGCQPQVLLPANANISSSGASGLGKPGLLSSSHQEYATLVFEKKDPLLSDLHFQQAFNSRL